MKAGLYAPRPLRAASFHIERPKAGGVSRPAVSAPLSVPAHLECHVTPEAVADEMVSWLPNLAGRNVLEPSAGTGNLARAVMRAHPDALLQCVEIYGPLAERLSGAGLTCDWCDFDEWDAGGKLYSAIIMNPPFKRVRQHIAKARSLLAPGGVLVALVPITFDGGDLIELLPADTFAACRVNTKIITMTKEKS